MTKFSKQVLPDGIPDRMIDDPGQTSYVRELLAAGRDDQVDGYDFDKGLSKHLGLVASGAPAPDWAKTLQPTTTGTATSATAAGAGAAVAGSKIAAWLAVPFVGAAVAAAVMFASHQAAQTALTAPAVVAPPLVQPAAEPVQVVQQAVDTTPASVPSVRSGESTRSPVAQRAKHVAATAVASKSAAATPSAAPLQGAAKPVQGGVRPSIEASQRGDLFATAEAAPQASARPVQPEAAAPAAPPPAPAVVAPARQDDAALEREMGMLSVAQRVLQSDPERALKLARQGEAEFAGSMFTQERQQLLLLSLIKLGRVDEAKRLARTYLARYPHGPFTDRVRRSLLSGRVER
jgi:hypothetical protein